MAIIQGCLAAVAAVLLIREVRRLAARTTRKLVISRRQVVDTWAKGYPARFTGPHGDHPQVRCEHWYIGHEPTTAAERDELVLDCAFKLEFHARRMFAGEQFHGILRGSTTLVSSAKEAREISRVLAEHGPGEAARACLDRALAWWEADPAEVATLPKVSAAIEAGEFDDAAQLWDSTRTQEPDSVLLSGELFRLETCGVIQERRVRSGDAGP